MPDNVKFFRISASEFDTRVSTTDSSKKLVVGGLYFVYDDADTTQGLIYQVTEVASSSPYTATTVVYGHESVSTSSGSSDEGKVPVLNSSGKLDNSFLNFITNNKINDSYIPSLYLNEFKGTYASEDALNALTTASTDTHSDPLDINVGDWALVNDTSTNTYGPYICTSITTANSTWQKIASPLGTRVTTISTPTDGQIPTALAVKTYVDTTVANGAITWEDIEDTTPASP